jgi:hypothetical protein
MGLDISLGLTHYRPTHFKVEELVPSAVYAARGDSALELIDPCLCYTMDCIREMLDIPLTINDWVWGGKAQYRGFRPQGCDVGAALSMHRLGRAIDFVSPKMKAADIRLKILEMNHCFPYISRMEDAVDWVHIDRANKKSGGIYLFKP